MKTVEQRYHNIHMAVSTQRIQPCPSGSRLHPQSTHHSELRADLALLWPLVHSRRFDRSRRRLLRKTNPSVDSPL
jgi:hypothetical protein